MAVFAVTLNGTELTGVPNPDAVSTQPAPPFGLALPVSALNIATPLPETTELKFSGAHVVADMLIFGVKPFGQFAEEPSSSNCTLTNSPLGLL